MAEGGLLNTEQGQSATSGSEFVFDFYCELCREDNLNVEADGYCVNCEEYLCKDCIFGHKRSRPTRHHEVLNQASMPKDTPLSYDRDSKDISTLCKLHKSKTVEYYCKSHKALACAECFATVHKHCADVESIHEKSENILDSQEYDDFVSSLCDMEQRSRDMTEKGRANITAAEQVRSAVTHQVRKFKGDLIEILENLEASLISKVETVTKEDINKMKRLEQELSSFMTEIEYLKSEIQPLVTSKRVCQLYIHMTERNNRIAMLERNLGEAEQNIGIRNLAFEANDNTMAAVKTTDSFGKIVIQESKSEADKTAFNDTQAHLRDIKAVSATHVSNIDFGTDSDISLCHYAISSAVVSSTRLLVADHHNKKVKLLDIDNCKLFEEVKLRDYPFDIAVVNENQAIVSTYFEQKLLSLKVQDTLKVEMEIAVNGTCRGVAYYQNQLFVTYEDNPRVEVMDLLGHVLKTIQNNANGVVLFKCPSNVHVSPKDGSIFVADTKANMIFCLTREGEVKHQYGRIRQPRAICSDQFGHLYVADFSSKTVHITVADFSESKTLLTDKDGLQKFVISVSYCKDSNCVFVGMSGERTVKAFKLI